MNVVFRKTRSAFRRLNKYLFQGPPFWFLMKIFIKPVYYTNGNESAIGFKNWFHQKVIGYNRHCYWPVHFTSSVIGWKNILAGIDTAPGISPNCYVDGTNNIYIGDYTQIAPNVQLITSYNKEVVNIENEGKIIIGKYCRIGMGSVIKPGVTLGDFTTVSAGSVITQSFPNGYCVIGGNPAKMLTDYSANESIKEKFVKYTNKYEYNGYIPAHKFESFRAKNLNV